MAVANSPSLSPPFSKLEPLKIIELNPEAGGRPRVDYDTTNKIISSRQVRDMDTLVVSIGGVARSGKSFLMNLFVSYLSYLEQVRH